MRRGIVPALVLFCLLFLGGCLGPLFFRTHYSLTGLPPDPTLAAEIEKTLKTEAKAIAPPDDDSARDAASAQAAATLRQTLTLRMHAQGFLDATAVFVPDDSGKNWSGTFALTPGARYTLTDITIKGMRPTQAERDWFQPLWDMKGQPLDAEAVLAALADLRRRLDRESCRFGLALSHAAVIDRNQKTARLDITIDQGVKARLGPLSIEGAETVRADYLARIIPWPQGACYSAKQIDDLRGALFQTGLFGGIDIVLPDRPDDKGEVPVTVTLQERTHRTISAGLAYYSDEGASASLGWKHRNFFGGAEVFDATLSLGQIRQGVETSLSLPFFLRNDQSLTLSAGLRQEDTDAYDLKTLDLGAKINRKFTSRLSGSTGVKASLSRIFDNAGQNTRTFGLVSFPQSLTYDSRNNALDPTRGWMIEGDAAPFVAVNGASDPFVRMSLSARTYHALATGTTLALRARVGSIQGPSLIDVPATERFYAGGSGSIRGFAYQSVGPQNGGDPTGGRGLFESSIELRHKFTDTIGAVAFVDAGSLSEETAPDFSELAVGAGIGLRYYTGIGPLRFDLATPLSQRDTTSDNIQFYISIGQAF